MTSDLVNPMRVKRADQFRRVASAERRASTETRHMPSHHWWWNDFLPWLEPLATCVGVCAAIVAAIYAAKVHGRESKRDRQEQAGKVTAWLEEQHESFDANGDRVKDPMLLVLNASTLPVYRVQILASDWLANRVFLTEVDVLVPDPKIKRFGYSPAEPMPSVSIQAVMEFTDASGQRWRRDVDGRLYEVRPPTWWQRRQEYRVARRADLAHGG